MAFKTRLDALVRIRDRVEETSKLHLAKSRQETQQAEQALAQARLRALEDHRRAGSAAEWENAEKARVRTLTDVKRAEELVRAARAREQTARQEFEKAHRQAEAVRRAADSKRQEMVREADRAERKHLDELAALQFGRRNRK